MLQNNKQLNTFSFMKKSKIFIISAFLAVFLSSCLTLDIVNMNSKNMNKLELGMSKEQVTNILGSGYTIAEKRIENEIRIEILSYRDTYKTDEFYLFVLKNNKLEKWYRELIPKDNVTNN